MRQRQQAARPRWGLIALATLAIGGLGAGVAMAGTTANKPAAASAGTITCPTVADKLPAVPASAQAEVTRNLALLQTQIDEANKRLATSVGQGGPNFVQNAILGPLADKRKSTIDRIAISIGRTAAKPTNLGGLETCTVSGAANTGTQAGGATGSTGGTGNTGNAGGGAGTTATGGSAAGSAIVCPTVADKLPAIPASALNEVNSNLGQLETQINEANNRLATTKGQGGPNFVQNAILGPLADKRTAAINRIATAIGRTAAKPTNLGGLATCHLA
jgi:hypothetical protein